MKFQGALIKEQGVLFGIVVAKSHVLNSPSDRNQILNFGIRAFGAVPIVLMAQDASGTPTYYGLKDIVRFLSSVPFQRIPWREYLIT